jgi:hypothetical protein
MGWFMNDFLFYGNKLFQSAFIKILNPGSAKNVVVNWNWNLVNIGVSLVGYYLSAILIDHKSLGRRRLQILGFAMDGALFLAGASELISFGSFGSGRLMGVVSLVSPVVYKVSCECDSIGHGADRSSGRISMVSK